MRIAIDCRCVFEGCGGIGRYAGELVRALARIDDGGEYVVIRSEHRPHARIVDKANFREVPVPAAMLDANWEQLELPLWLEEQAIDLYHNPTFSVPVIQPCPTIATIHDVVFRLRPDLVRDSLRQYLDLWAETAALSATHILTVSQFSKDTIARAYGIPPEKISVIYEGVDSDRFPPAHSGAREAELRKRFGIEGPYILYVGAIEPKKNIDMLLHAFREAKQQAGLPHVLVLGGPSGGTDYNVAQAVFGFGLDKEVVVTGYLPERLLPYAYNGAEAFVYISQYEGFGLPPLEAMACGVPTLVSDATSLPEVVGDGAIIVDPYDAEAIATALVQLCTDDQLRADLRERGQRRAAQFSWQLTAWDTLKLYRHLASRETKECE